MAIQILVSPPASGKTSACIKTIQTLLAQKPTAKAWVIVRDRLQAGYFRGRMAAAGGAMNVRIATFHDLYLEILEGSDRPIPPQLPAAMQLRLVQGAISRAELEYFAPLRSSSGLGEAMQALIAELQRALVTPADLLAQADPDRPGHTELARVYQSHLHLLETTGWIDPEGLARQAIQALSACPALLADWDLLVVDGFDWFEAAQIQALKSLAERVQQVLVTLPGLLPWKRTAHRHFEKTHTECSRALAFQTLPPLEQVHLPGPLAALEAGLLETGAAPFAGLPGSIHLLEARSPGEEAREALRWIKARILRENARPAGCAVLVHDPDTYFPCLRQAAAEFGMPLRFTQGRRLVDSPAIAAVINLLSLPASNYPRRVLLDALRSPFFDFSGLGLDDRQVDVLDLISRHGKIIAGVEQWAEVFSALEQPADPVPAENASGEDSPAAQADSREEEEAYLPALPRGAAARRLWAALQRVFDLLRPPQERSTHGWVEWMESCLAALQFYAAGQAPENAAARPALLALRDALQGLLAAETVLVEPALQASDYPTFLAALQSALAGTEYVEESAPAESAVLAMRLIESRGLRFDSVAILGLAEGGFPHVERPDPILDEAIRQRLGMSPRLEQDQVGLFYQAVTRADEALLLTRPYLSENGDPWEASPYWNAAAALFPGTVRRVRPEDIRPLSEAASAQEALFWAARQGASETAALPAAFAGLSEAYTRILAARQQLARLLGRNPYAPADERLRGLIQARLGAEQVWSASRLETYLACPSRFFIQSFLGIEANEPPDWDYDPAQLGSLLHAILEQAYRSAADPSDPEAVLAVLPEVARRAFAEAPARYGFRPSPLWEQQREELLERLAGTVSGLAELDGGWRPLRFEQAFGYHDAPPLALVIDGQQVQFHGFIDRIDINDAGALRIIDYKTGSSHLSARDLAEGRRLQLAVYALAARDALGLGEPVEGFYWRIGPDGRSALQLSRFKHETFAGPEGALAIAQEHIGRALSGLHEASFPPAPLDGKCSSYCPASSWCWHYQPE